MPYELKNSLSFPGKTIIPLYYFSIVLLIVIIIEFRQIFKLVVYHSYN